jgi:hypothetical protein
MACTSGLLSPCVIVTVTGDIIVIIIVVVVLSSICRSSIITGLALALVVLCVGRPHRVTGLAESTSDWRIGDARTPTSKRCCARSGVALFDISGRSPCAFATQTLRRHSFWDSRTAGRKGLFVILWRAGVVRDILCSLVEHVLVGLLLNVVRQGNVSRRTIAADIVAVFVLDTEQCPDTAADDF